MGLSAGVRQVFLAGLILYSRFFVQGRPLRQLNTSVLAEGSFSNASMSAKRARNAASTWAVVQLPNYSQITFGGLPRRTLRLL